MNQYEKAVADFGLSLEIIEGPVGCVEKIASDTDYPQLFYECKLLRDGYKIWTGPYYMGVGCVQVHKPTPGLRLSIDEEHLFSTWQRQPMANFVDKHLYATVAAKVARAQKVVPSVTDIVYTLLSDGMPYYNGDSFEDWCGDYGFDTDSRKAYETWLTCCDIGRQMVAGLGYKNVEALREAFEGY